MRIVIALGGNALLAVLALSIGLDLWWKRVRAGRASGGTTSDVQVGN